MSNKEDQKYIDAVKIVDAYERAFSQERTRVAVLLDLNSALSVAEVSARGIEFALGSMEEETNTEPIEESVTAVDSNNSEAKNSCGPNEEIKKANAWLKDNREEIETAPIDALTDLVNSISDGSMTPEEMSSTLKKCFNCNLRMNFNFQFKPINFLSELSKFVKDLANQIDKALDILAPKTDSLKNICALMDLKIWCPSDLLSLIMAYKMLLKNYMSMSFSVSLNWTFLVGPLLNWIVNFVGSALEQVKSILFSIIDCATSALVQVTNVRGSALEAVDSTVEWSGKIASMFSDISWEEFRSNNVLKVDKSKPTDKQIAEKGESAKVLNLPTGISYSYSDSFESAKQKEIRAKEASSKLPPLQFLDRSILALNSWKEWINNLVANIMLSVKSLNSWINGTLSSKISLDGQILFLFDIIKLIKTVYEMSQMGFEDFCKTLQEDPEVVKEKMIPYGYDIAEIKKEVKSWEAKIAEIENNYLNSCGEST